MAERWVGMEIMGKRRHLGRLTEEVIAGTSMLRVEVLQRDGNFHVRRYGGAALFGLHDVTEAEARREVMRAEWTPCHAHVEPSAIEGLCARCGFPADKHGQASRALPPARREPTADDPCLDDEEDEDEDTGDPEDDELPPEVIDHIRDARAFHHLVGELGVEGLNIVRQRLISDGDEILQRYAKTERPAPPDVAGLGEPGNGHGYAGPTLAPAEDDEPMPWERLSG